MSSAQIVSASVLQNKLSPPPPLPQAVFSAAPRVRTAPCPSIWGHLGMGGDTEPQARAAQGTGGMFAGPLVVVGMQGGLWGLPAVCSRGGEEFGRGESEAADPSLCCFPSFGVGLSQDSLDPLRSKYKTPLLCRARPPLGKGLGWSGLR